MKYKAQWATAFILSAMLIIAIMTGCSGQYKDSRAPSHPPGVTDKSPEPTQTERVELDRIGQEIEAMIRELEESQGHPFTESEKAQLMTHAGASDFKEIDFSRYLKSIPDKREASASEHSYTTKYIWRGFDVSGRGLSSPESGAPVLSKIPVLGEIPLNGGLFHGASSSDGIDSLSSRLAYVSADEVWVIVKPSGQAVPDGEYPGCGVMMVDMGEEAEDVPLPLKHTDVKGHIYGYIASVDVTQEFHNPFDTKIEAEYVFPLPQNAAVDEFIMTIGKRKIRGIIRERQEAEKIYEQAKAQGYTASLLTQERPNIFTQKVANIEPGKNIDVSIHYFNTLAYVDGSYEFVFPMVVGPRYNPPHTTDGVGAVAVGSGGISGQKTEVQYLAPNQRSGHDISLSVEIEAGTKIEGISCTSHVVSKDLEGKERATISISPNDSIPNKDFVLRYKVAGDRVKSAMVTHSDGEDNYFTMMLYPPEDLSHLKRAPVEMIFVVDCSGSMSGYPMEKAKGAIKRALKKLGTDDTFQVIRFSSNASQLGPKPVCATKNNIRKGIRYVNSLKGGGGTQMIEGIKAALDFEHDPKRLRLVSFMTDGYIGNETEILVAVHEKLGDARIFSFGVGNSVNRYLLDRMAKLGKGAVAYIGLKDNSAEIVDAFYDRISHPALTDIEIDWGGMDVSDVFPAAVPDLFVGRPVILTGKFDGYTDAAIRVNGTVDGERRDVVIAADSNEAASSHEGVAAIWARKKIEQLAALQITTGDGDYADQIKDTALRYGLMSAYTAFVAVDSSRKTEGDHGVTVPIAVPVPDGVRYDTTVQN